MGRHSDRKGHPLEGVGPGTTLDGRYTTQRRIEQRHGAERWTADDTTLGRSVIVLCLPEADHRAAALLDAARRAAGPSRAISAIRMPRSVSSARFSAKYSRQCSSRSAAAASSSVSRSRRNSLGYFS